MTDNFVSSSIFIDGDKEKKKKLKLPMVSSYFYQVVISVVLAYLLCYDTS